MRRGPWHQCGDKSQRMVIEEIQHDAGVGVVVSPRDLPFARASEYAREYHALGTHVMIDLQFCNPQFSNDRLASYPTSNYRASISQLNQISNRELRNFITDLQQVEGALNVDGVIAPAVKYEAGRPDIVRLNAMLFKAAKEVAKNLSVPVYATVILGSSATSTDQTLNSTLSQSCSFNCDGWYYAFEFPQQERIPSVRSSILRCCYAGLKLACTGKPVFHAYAGPMSLLSFAFGATATGIGHWQNLWQFSRGRWEQGQSQGGGGDAPPRFFSRNLWGTIVYPDELAQLPTALRSQVYTPSPFSPAATSGPFIPWDRWSANKHLVFLICQTVDVIAAAGDPRASATEAMRVLERAVALHGQIAATNLRLADDTSSYQQEWLTTLRQILVQHADDFDYIELLS